MIELKQDSDENQLMSLPDKTDGEMPAIALESISFAWGNVKSPELVIDDLKVSHMITGQRFSCFQVERRVRSWNFGW